ncbi:hypothetical protein LX69_02681 [Breznakibacter xylanolyticus]|uniref:AhpC/TSA family protein n=1 Tax=Breznakibacter xylanolyticus TaxID=990 RepID=A0A2W7MZ60_9BACT|nr:hypothetical protein [Breznakibacter xylanolyticus]PZX13425.1 hypothetical protein LX69_02681 [Breznakibacter xylanolyticus]
MKKLISLLIILQITTCCNLINNKSNQENSILGVKLSLPTKKLPIIKQNNCQVDSSETMRSEFKIVCAFNVDCSICIDKMVEWSNIAKEMEYMNLKPVFYIKSSEIERFEYIYENNLKCNALVFNDEEQLFEKINSQIIRKNIGYLINKNNKIIAFSTTTEKEKTIDHFKSAIRKHIYINTNKMKFNK